MWKGRKTTAVSAQLGRLLTAMENAPLVSTTQSAKYGALSFSAILSILKRRFTNLGDSLPTLFNAVA